MRCSEMAPTYKIAVIQLYPKVCLLFSLGLLLYEDCDRWVKFKVLGISMRVVSRAVLPLCYHYSWDGSQQFPAANVP